MILEEVSDLLQNFLDTSLFLLVCMKNLQKGMVRRRVVCKPTLDSCHIRNCMIEFHSLLRHSCWPGSLWRRPFGRRSRWFSRNRSRSRCWYQSGWCTNWTSCSVCCKSGIMWQKTHTERHLWLLLQRLFFLTLQLFCLTLQLFCFTLLLLFLSPPDIKRPEILKRNLESFWQELVEAKDQIVVSAK